MKQDKTRKQIEFMTMMQMSRLLGHQSPAGRKCQEKALEIYKQLYKDKPKLKLIKGGKK